MGMKASLAGYGFPLPDRAEDRFYGNDGSIKYASVQQGHLDSRIRGNDVIIFVIPQSRRPVARAEPSLEPIWEQEPMFSGFLIKSGMTVK